MIDAQGVVLAGAPEFNPDGDQFGWSGHIVRDRDYFTQAIERRGPYISDVFLGRGYGQDPIVAVSAAQVDDSGGIKGVVQASSPSAASAEFWACELQRLTASLLVLDRNRRVVYASPGLDWEATDDLPGKLKAANAEKQMQLPVLNDVYSDQTNAPYS